jgi:hypothetical protein
MQIGGNALSYLGLHTAAHEQQAGTGKSSRNDNHGKKELGP